MTKFRLFPFSFGRVLVFNFDVVPYASKIDGKESKYKHKVNTEVHPMSMGDILLVIWFISSA